MTVTITEDVFGQQKDPYVDRVDTIKRFTFTNSNHVTVQVISLGATITTIKVPDGCGKVEDVVCGFDDVAGYEADNNPYFGCIVGRVCNRVGNGTFLLNGTRYNVNKNFFGRHQLHGGFIGFNKAHFDAKKQDEDNTVVMTHMSADGDEGYPGQVTVKCVFKLTDENQFYVNFYATTTKPTPVSLTNHSYFNLAGHNAGPHAIYEHFIKIKADKITETDEDSIPTGNFTDVEGTPYDLKTLGQLGPRMQRSPTKGFDDNFCVTLDDNKTTVIAKVWHPQSGRFLEVSSNQPGVQLYTSNSMPNPAKNETPIKGKGGVEYIKHGALCLETQKYPDAVNHDNFPSVIVNPGETYDHEVIYSFGTCREDAVVCQSKRK